MGLAWRHAFAILALPFTVVVIVPVWIARASAGELGAPASWLEWAISLAGIVPLAGGAALFVTSLRRFDHEGKGTLAPWDPPTTLVIRGPYAHVRNPMIAGVALLLVAEALLLRSFPHLGWAIVFALVNALYIPLVEEPALRARFGQEYGAYASHVPRLVPRLMPWRGE